MTFGTGVVEQVAERVVPGLERVRRLSIGVVVVLPRVADSAAELLAPRVIEERHEADDRDRLADGGASPGLPGLFTMPMSTGESFMSFWMPSPKTNCRRMTSFAPP